MSRNAIDMVGEIYGSLSVLRRSENIGKDSLWICKCLICDSNNEYRRTQILRKPKKCKSCRKGN